MTSLTFKFLFLLPFLFASNLLASAGNPGDLEGNYQRLSSLMSHYGKISHDLFNEASRNLYGELSEKDQNSILNRKDEFMREMEEKQNELRQVYLDLNPASLKSLTLSYGNYVLKTAGSSSLSSKASLESLLQTIEDTQESLAYEYELLLGKHPSLWHRISDYLFFNYASATLASWAIKLGGNYLTIRLGRSVWTRVSGPDYQAKPGYMHALLETFHILETPFGKKLNILASKFGGIIQLISTYLGGLYMSWTVGNMAYDLQVEESSYRHEKAEQQAEQEAIHKEAARKYIAGRSEFKLNDVVGFYDLKETEIKLAVDFLKDPLKYKRNRNTNTYSLLLYGPPGTGKTLLARAIAGEAGVPIIKITADDLFAVDSNDKLRAIWAVAAESAQASPTRSAVIYIDEIDLAIGGEGSRTGLDSTKSKALSNLLTLLDGVEQGNPYTHILTLMSTNVVEHIDPALLRPGRIDKALYIGLPEQRAREELFQRQLPENNAKLAHELSTLTDGLSPAHIVNIIESANMRALLERKNPPTLEMYKHEIERIRKNF